MIRSKILVAVAVLALLFAVGACKEEGPAERMGKRFDEAVDDLRDAGDGPFERLGESIDEAIEDTQEAIDEAVESAKQAAQGED